MFEHKKEYIFIPSYACKPETPCIYNSYINQIICISIFSRDTTMVNFLYQIHRFEKHRKGVLSQLHWEMFSPRKLLQKDLNIQRLIHSHANNFYSDEDYAGVKVSWNKFYRNLFDMRRRSLRNSFFKEQIDDEDVNHGNYFLRLFINYTLMIQQRPMFHFYANQAYQMWYSSGVIYGPDSQYNAVECLKKQEQVNSEEWLSPEATATEEALNEVYKHNKAFKEAFRDYHFWLNWQMFNFVEDVMLKKFIFLNSKTIMFYSFTLNYCGAASEESVINRSFMNLDIFVDAFNCWEDTPMNQLNICGI